MFQIRIIEEKIDTEHHVPVMFVFRRFESGHTDTTKISCGNDGPISVELFGKFKRMHLFVIIHQLVQDCLKILDKKTVDIVLELSPNQIYVQSY